jgi:hypothetical protein
VVEPAERRHASICSVAVRPLTCVFQ